MFNIFVSKRIKKEDSPDKILFEIESVKSQTNNETYSATSGLENLTGQPLNFQILQTENLQEKLEEGGSQPNQNFLLDDNDGSKKKRLRLKRQQKNQRRLIHLRR